VVGVDVTGATAAGTAVVASVVDVDVAWVDGAAGSDCCRECLDPAMADVPHANVKANASVRGRDGFMQQL